MNVPLFLNTARLSIEPLTLTDDSFILELVNSEGWLQFIGDRNIHSETEARAYIQKITDNPNIFYWVAKLKDGGDTTGIVTFIKRDHLEHPDIGFAFLPRFYGKGYAYEATQAVLQQLTSEYHFTHISAVTIPQNTSSIALLKKLGMAFQKEIEGGNDKLHVYGLLQIQIIIADIKSFLIATFSTIDTWFEKNAALRDFKPADGGWTINEILEHIGLTNHFLLILIDKGTSKALQNVHKLDMQAELKNYIFQVDKLKEIGMYKSFAWIRPAHMEPTGSKTLPDIRVQIKEQAHHCLDTLDKLKNGEGVLYKTTMTVNNLGKINVYEYIYFLAQHALRHITQMQNNESEFVSRMT